jgi:hypothetical protein
MKYIITESRLNQLIFNYLDNQDWYDWDIGDSEFNMAEGEHGRDLIRFRVQYSHTVPDHSFDVIYIDEGLITKLSKLFSIPDLISIKTVIQWFNKRYTKNLSIDDFEWMDTDYSDDDN